MGVPLYRFRASLPCTDPDDLLNIVDKYLAITNVAGVGRFFNGFQHPVQHILLDCGFDFDLGQKVNHVFCTAI